MAGRPLPERLPEDMEERFQERLPAIRARLDDFAAIPRAQWFYELCYCLLTPQSKAANADIVVKQLQEIDFQHRGGDVVHLLRAPQHYIRFHNQKARRLELARSAWADWTALLDDDRPVRDRRDALAGAVNGFGLKEASHFMRNVGFRGLGIIDRHLLTYLVRTGIYAKPPQITTPRRYHAVERRFSRFADRGGYDMDELDLFFWSEMTGFILK